MGTRVSREVKVGWLTHRIEDFFKKRPAGVISKEKLLAEFALRNMSTMRTGIEILTLLEKTNFIKVKGDDITK